MTDIHRAIDALLAFRHGNTKHLTKDHARILFEAISAQQREPVTVKPLVWVDHRPDSFPEPAWSAQTPFGFYNIEEVSASDCPAYVVRLHAHRFVADKDSLDDAKAAAQADYEARIRSALETGWHLAPAHATSGDVVIEAAVAEIEERFAAAIRAGRGEG